jgi:mono/diheme cytochrome c family protein
MMWRATSGVKQAAGVALAALSLQLIWPALGADDAPPVKSRTFSSGYRFVEMSGEELYFNVCRGCHMMDAMGASGAGSYPSLVANPNLQASGYAIDLVLNGRRAMPPFGEMMSDDQIAAVVNYLRTHFGNNYEDAVTAKEVKAARR